MEVKVWQRGEGREAEGMIVHVCVHNHWSKQSMNITPHLHKVNILVTILPNLDWNYQHHSFSVLFLKLTLLMSQNTGFHPPGQSMSWTRYQMEQLW